MMGDGAIFGYDISPNEEMVSVFSMSGDHLTETLFILFDAFPSSKASSHAASMSAYQN